MTRLAQVSVVIPTFNRQQRLHRVLTGLAQQTIDVEMLEVIVVSDGSTDGTDAYFESRRTPLPVDFVRQANQGPAAARNHGVVRATADLVLFIDDDVMPDARLVEEHLAVHARNPRAAVIGPMIEPLDATLSCWARWEQAMLEKQYRAMAEGKWLPSPRQFYTGNASIRRLDVLEAGGFDTEFTRAEDVELAYRLADLGVSFHFNAAAIGYHYVEREYASWRNVAYMYGRNDVRFGRDLGQPWLLEAIKDEFSYHHPFVRGLTHLQRAAPRVGLGVEHALGVIGRGSDRIGARRLSRYALSGVFNTEYYRGIDDELREGPQATRPRPALQRSSVDD